MKKNLVKILPLMAAVLLATSCSKDDDNVQTQNLASLPQTQSTIPFSIRVNTGKSLTKIGYAEDNANPGYYNLTFTDDDVTEGLTLVIKEGGKELGGLKLQKDKETFLGEIDEPSSDQAELTAEIVVGGTVSSVTTEITDLFANCKHTFRSETFTPDAEEIALTDQNAYLSVTLPAEETSVSVNGKEYAVANGKVWIAFDASQPVQSARLSLFNKQAEPGKIYTVTREKSKFEAKAFTVYEDYGGRTRKVYFSPGNLLYQASTETWTFAARQYDFVGNAAGNTTTDEYDGRVLVAKLRENNVAYIDLFGWGTWIDENKSDKAKPTNDSKNSEDYTARTTEDRSGYRVFDKNKTTINSEVWTTLSYEEWTFLCKRDKNRKIGFGEVDGVNGMILLPDDWTYPTNLSESSTSENNFRWNNSSADDYHNSYTAADWEKMEANGAVFLPAAGYRDGTEVKYANSKRLKRYWTSASNGSYAHDFATADGHYRYYGQAVRLVRQVN